jgi:hypothetical protein
MLFILNHCKVEVMILLFAQVGRKEKVKRGR